jgi:hypothetical protein
MPIEDLRLRAAQPSDRPHLLIWDTPEYQELKALVYRENAELISYRIHVLNRIDTNKPFLALHLWLERELDAIKAMCSNTANPVVLLKDLDCLITYLRIQPESPITLFWQNLFYTRHLQSILWIVLPSKLTPPNWDDSRILRI